jgi:hypothetical protein
MAWSDANHGDPHIAIQEKRTAKWSSEHVSEEQYRNLK